MFLITLLEEKYTAQLESVSSLAKHFIFSFAFEISFKLVIPVNLTKVSLCFSNNLLNSFVSIKTKNPKKKKKLFSKR